MGTVCGPLGSDQISFALALPITVIVSGSGKNAVPIIAAMSVILGTIIGIAGHFLK